MTPKLPLIQLGKGVSLGLNFKECMNPRAVMGNLGSESLRE